MSTNSVIGTRISRLLIVVLAGAVVLGGVPAGASVIDAGPVQVGTSPSDHPQDYIAISNGGTATSTCWTDGPLGASSCPGLLSASTDGSTSGGGLVGATLTGDNCASGVTVSVSAGGAACGGGVAVSGAGSANGSIVAVSGTGTAQAGWVAASGAGPASSGVVAASGMNSAQAPVAVSPRTTVRDITPEDFRETVEFVATLLTGGVIDAGQALVLVLDIFSGILRL